MQQMQRQCAYSRSGAAGGAPQPCRVPGAVLPRLAIPSRKLSIMHSTVTAVGVDVESLQAENVALRAENEALRSENEALHLELGQLRTAAVSEPVAAVAPVKSAGGITAKGVLASVASLLEAHDLEGLATLEVPVINEALAMGINWPKANERFWERAPRSEPFPLQLQDSAAVPQERDARPLQIMHIAAELAPIGKVGGLGDVVAGLSKACLDRGHDVSVIMPFYESLDQKQIDGLKHEMDIDVPKGYLWDGEMRVGSLRTSVFSGRVAGVPVHLIRPTDWGSCNLFKGGRIYGGSYDDREAYLYMCRAALEYMKCSGQQPHIIQVHDWHTAAVPLLYWEAYHGDGLPRPRIVLTIHNLDNTGECRQDEFYYTGLPGEPFATADKALDERTIGHNPERINLMKGGIIYSNAVTTVSPTYASDITNAGAGGFLKPIFGQDHVRAKFQGILNGVDASDWNPAADPLLPANFNAQLPAGKALCKEFLQKGLGLEVDPTKPIVAVVSRLVNQKNPGLMAAAAMRCRDNGAQFVLLGSGGQDGGLKKMAENELKDHPSVRVLIMYSERLAHMIYAASDIVLVPSNFEPCGLTQMLAMRYGALPCVRRTGGLADTVRDVDTSKAPEEERNGFSFDGTDANSLHGALDRAVALFKDDPERWRELSLRNMAADVSWARPAKEYVDLYNKIAVMW